MKAIMISKSPKIVANVLNSLASILIFKTCPKDWKDYLSGKNKEMPESIDVYIYCTKQRGGLFIKNKKHEEKIAGCICEVTEDVKLNNKVVAKFTLNKMEEITNYGLARRSETMMKEVLEKSCLTMGELNKYATHKEYDDKDYIYAWHISNLEIFDEPKELSEFRNAFKYKRFERVFGNNNIEKDEHTEGLRQPVKGGYEYVYPLTKAPQSWCYVEALL